MPMLLLLHGRGARVQAPLMNVWRLKEERERDERSRAELEHRLGYV
jgi:hypothetical protein